MRLHPPRHQRTSLPRMWGADMRLRWSIRRWYKWAGVTICSLLLILWAFSIWNSVSWEVRVGKVVWYVLLTRGSLLFGRWPDSGVPHKSWWTWTRLEPEWFVPGLPRQRYHGIQYPVWLLLVLVTLPTIYLFWCDRR